jgi:hypothetical protein
VQQIVKAYEAYTVGGGAARPPTLRGEPVEPRA